MRAPLSVSPRPAPPSHVCCSGFLSLPSAFCPSASPFPKSRGLPWPLLPPAAVSTWGQEWDQEIQDPGIPGPWAGPQDGHGATGAQQPTFLSSLPPPHTLSARAVQLQRGLSTSRAGGRAAALGLCFEPRGSLLLPPPALPDPGPCAACPPCPFVPKAGGGGRPTAPEAGHQP